MKNSIITIGVKSMNESLCFYRDILGFSLDNVVKPAPGVELNWLSNKDQLVVELVKIENAPEPVNKQSSLTLTFMVDDLSKKEDLLIAKKIDYKTITLPNGLNVHRFKDPNGIDVSFMDIMKY